MKIIQMGPGRQWSAKPLILPEDYRKEFESHVLLGFSGISRIATCHAKRTNRKHKIRKVLGSP